MDACRRHGACPSDRPPDIGRFRFFRTDSIDLDSLHRVVLGLGKCKTLQSEAQTLTVDLDGCMLSYFIVRDPFIFPTRPFRGFQIADMRDIALMKMVAISSRGVRKDFIDLYEILQLKVSLKECFDWFDQKYGPDRGSRRHILMSLCWFEEAEAEPMPEMLKEFDGVQCKRFFKEETAKFFA